MAATLAGEAAIRIVPSLRNFRNRVQNELSRKPMKFDIEIRPKVDTSLAEAQLDKFRAAERANAINLRAKVDIREARQAFSQVEHIFKRSAIAKAIRLNIVVAGGDAIYAAVGALGSLSAAADVAVKSLVAIPGALASAGVAAGVFAVAMQDVKKAITAVQTEQDQSADKARAQASAARDQVKANRDVGRAVKDVGAAYRDATRDVEDMIHAVRRGSLDEAGALLNLQDALDDLAGGADNLKELRRQQLGLAEAYDDLSQVQVKNRRNQQDLQSAQADGINGNKQVVAALDSVQDAMDRVAESNQRMADSMQTKTDTGAFARLAPSAQEFVRAITDAHGAWVEFGQSLQQPFFEGQAKNLTDTINTVKGLGPELQGVSKQLGGVFLDLGAALRDPKNAGNLKGIIGNTETGITTLRRAIDPLVSGLLRISNSSAFPSLAGWIEKLSNRWDAWTAKIKADGSMETWIQNGIKGLDSLVNSATNIVVIVNNVAAAWRAAGGESSGVIGSLEQVTTKLKDWSASASGQNSMITYFRDVRDFIGRVIDALRGMGPTFQAIGQFTRQWSAVMLEVLSTGLQLTNWVQENFGVIRPLLFLWLTWRTVAPLVSGVSTAMQNLTKMTAGLGNAGVPVFSNMNNGMRQFKSNMDALKGATSSAIDPTKRMTLEQVNYARATQGAFTGTNNLTKAFATANPQLSAFGATAATVASNKIGFAGVKAGLMGAVGGLASFLGPQAAFAVAMAAGVWAVNKLGEAHRNAAKDADTQRAALDQLKGSIDSVTGAVTAQAAQQTAKSGQAYTIPNFPGGNTTRNVLQDITRALPGTSAGDLVAATNPVNQQQRTDLLARLDNAAKAKIEQSPEWQRGKDFWEGHGVSSEVLARASNGDQQALDAVRNAEKAAYDPHNTGNLGDQFYQRAQRAKTGISTVSDVIAGAGTYDIASSGIFLRDTSTALNQAGTATQAANAAAAGTYAVKPGDNFGGPGARVYSDGTSVKLETSGPVPPDWATNMPAGAGQAVILPDGRGQIVLTPEAIKQHLDKKREGGIIRGKGTGTSDSNIIAASAGEFIVRKKAVDALGAPYLDHLNNGGIPAFQGGGWFPVIPKPPVPAPVAPPAGGIFPVVQKPAYTGPPQVAGPAISGPSAGGNPLGLLGANKPTYNVPPQVAGPAVQGPNAGGNPLAAATPFRPRTSSQDVIDAMTPPHGIGSFAGASTTSPGVDLANKYMPWMPTTPAPMAPPNRVQPSNKRAPTRGNVPPVPHRNTGTTTPASTTTPTGVSHHGGPGTPAPTTSGMDVTPATAATAPGPVANIPTADAQGNYPYQPYPTMGQQVVQTPLGPMAMPNANQTGGSYGLPQGTDTGGYGNAAGAGTFPQWAIDLGAQFGVTPSTYAGHQETDRAEAGYAPNPNHENRGIDWTGTPENMQRFADYLKTVPGMEQVIWNGGGIGTGDTVEIAGGRPQPGYFAGDLAGHGNHVHTRQSTPIPLPGQSVGAAGGVPGISNFQGFVTDPATGQLVPATGGTGGKGGKKDPFGQDALKEFFGGQAQQVGQNLMSIALQFVQGFTGLDFSGLLGAGQQIAGHYLGNDKDSGDSTGLTEGSGIDNLVTGDINSYMGGNGALGLDLSPDVMANLLSGAQGTPGITNQAATGAGVDQWDPVIDQVLAYLVSQGQISSAEVPQWKAAVKRQMKFESGGANGLTNQSDSNAAAGHPSQGLMQVIPGTFAAFKPAGFSNDIMDPAANIAASIMYAKSKGGPSYMTGTHGYARGGRHGGGLARVSRGEYRFGPKAARRIGYGNLMHLNRFGAGGLIGGAAVLPKPPLPPPVPPKPFQLGPSAQPLIGPAAGAAPAPVAPPQAPLIGPAAAPPPPPPVTLGSGLPSVPPIGLGQGLGANLSPGAQPGALSGSGMPGQIPTAPGQTAPGQPFQGRDATTGEQRKPGDENPDERGLGAVGAAPASNEHNAPWVSGAIQGIAQAAGNAGAMAASMGSMGMDGGMAGSMISAGAQMAGQIATSAMNVLSSAGIGSIMDIGTKATPSGAALIPQRAPQQFGQLPAQSLQPAVQPGQQPTGGPQIVNNYNGGIHTQNMDEWQRRQQRVMDQQSQPYISKYSTI